ncbi:MAG TPA: hypothetical protein VGG60_00445, partial [Candidatus Binataceae bacterium]
KVVSALVRSHRERINGGGYYRGVRGRDLSPADAAEAYQTSREARPHRAALSDAGAAQCRLFSTAQ